jgi:tRNA-specific 2-thiouridylase
VRCNQWIKFDALLDRARAFDADILATGHYARVREAHGSRRLLRGADPRKDQSYVLWMLSQEELARCAFPVGEMQKSETRRIARDLGLRTAAKPDSQEICFVRGGDVRAYVSDRIPEANRPGPILDTSGRLLGEHRGIGHYTVGQRKGLGVALGHPVFVAAIDPVANAVVVGGHEEVATSGFVGEEVSFVGESPIDGCEVLVQHRAHGDVAPARIYLDSGGFEIVFDRPVEAVAPGQSAALYSAEDPDELLGGGIIASTTTAELDVRGAVRP